MLKGIARRSANSPPPTRRTLVATTTSVVSLGFLILVSCNPKATNIVGIKAPARSAVPLEIKRGGSISVQLKKRAGGMANNAGVLKTAKIAPRLPLLLQLAAATPMIKAVVVIARK